MSCFEMFLQSDFFFTRTLILDFKKGPMKKERVNAFLFQQAFWQNQLADFVLTRD